MTSAAQYQVVTYQTNGASRAVTHAESGAQALDLVNHARRAGATYVRVHRVLPSHDWGYLDPTYVPVLFYREV